MTSNIMITGVSTGLGRAIATAALAAGHTVIGTVRQPDQAAAFEALAPGRAHARQLDLTVPRGLASLAAELEESFGGVDVLVNNAGYGVEGVFEETPLEVFRRQFEVNVLGTVAVTQAMLPGMRRRRAGHVIFITSMGGLRAFPGLAAYHGSKYALEGIADSLRMELAPLGIKVTSVEPGSFRTDWAGRSMTRVERSIADYDTLIDPVRAARQAMSGQQIGDPAKAGTAILALLDAQDPPGHLILGADALRFVREAREVTDREIRDWEQLSASTDFSSGKTYTGTR
jgi:NAD(P)-dependent dehydrogenase (short-subunit alcohol dehydrogenase family)